MEMPMDDAPQFVRISELIMMSPFPVIIHPVLGEIMTLVGMLEASHLRAEHFKRTIASQQDDPCPAIVEYSPIWDELHEKIITLIKELNVEETVAKIQKLDEEFEFTRLRTIATCPKEGCPDREGAQAELGFVDGEEVLQ
jgi:hypothetical protein